VIFTFPETGMIVLPESEDRMIVSSLLCTKHRNMTDRQMDRQTDRNAVAITALALPAMLTRCKNSAMNKFYYAARNITHCSRTRPRGKRLNRTCFPLANQGEKTKTIDFAIRITAQLSYTRASGFWGSVVRSVDFVTHSECLVIELILLNLDT